MATESPMITPFPGAKLYRLTATQLEFLSVRQNVLGKKKKKTEKILFYVKLKCMKQFVFIYSWKTWRKSLPFSNIIVWKKKLEFTSTHALNIWKLRKFSLTHNFEKMSTHFIFCQVGFPFFKFVYQTRTQYIHSMSKISAEDFLVKSQVDSNRVRNGKKYINMYISVTHCSATR